MSRTLHNRKFQFVDRLYGPIEFPPFISALISCPSIMRLREVRMANINFIHFPGLSDITRFEHSLGTCCLARVAAERMGMNERESLTLMAAALYHDVATPPFAHATEEVFKEKFGFDHETKMFQVLAGLEAASTIARGEFVPVFRGRRALLPKICHSPRFRSIRIDPIEVAETANGHGTLGPLIKGDMDLDNIDNVVRAAVNMAINVDVGLAVRLAGSFALIGGDICLSASALGDFEDWQRLRWAVYDRIFADTEDFALQSMLKSAVYIAFEEGILNADDWCATDHDLMFVHLRKSDRAWDIIDRMRLGDLFQLVDVFHVKDPSTISLIGSCPDRVELEQEVMNRCEIPVVINYFLDKRVRPLHRPVLSGTTTTRPTKGETHHVTPMIVGIFSPAKEKISRETRRHILETIGVEPHAQLVEAYPHRFEGF